MKWIKRIPNKNIFKAVSFARSMKQDGESIGLAIHIAAKYYKVNRADVAREMGSLANVHGRLNKEECDTNNESQAEQS